MSPTSSEDPSAHELTFRSVNGSKIKLYERKNPRVGADNSSVVKFELHNEKSLNVSLSLLLLVVTLFLWIAFECAIPWTIAAVALSVQCIAAVKATNKGTLLVIKYVGVHIADKKVFSGFDSHKFLPWDTVQDVFINEVITGQKVLYYLTFVVRETVGGRDLTKLVPLFHNLVPERKCLVYMYERNKDHFMYSKELLKIIRRIIKYRPSQGQQFSTKHLLVTYHHTSWTRQDKMFAILKFRERAEATTNNRAFVLSVRICRPSLYQSDVESASTPYAQSRDQRTLNLRRKGTNLDNLNAKSRTEVVNHVKGNTSENVRQESSRKASNVQDEQPEVTIVEDDECAIIDIVEKKKPNRTTRRTQYRNLARKDGKFVSRKRAKSSQRDENQGSSTEDSIDRAKTPKLRKKVVELQISSDTDTSSADRTSNVEGEKTATEQDDSRNTGKRRSRNRGRRKTTVAPVVNLEEEKPSEQVAECTPLNSSSNSSDSEEIPVDSVNLPYQYLIEKEIEDAKNSMTSSAPTKSDAGSATEGDPNATVLTDSVNIGEQNSKGTVESSGEEGVNKFNQERRKLKCKKDAAKRESDDAGLRSSDITDLVMEGLMFTIRQDRDSVSVLEQKTKLEVDEVLENSEKAETKEGEKCLLNSSLLKLENLISKIELSQAEGEHGANEDNASRTSGVTDLSVEDTEVIRTDTPNSRDGPDKTDSPLKSSDKPPGPNCAYDGKALETDLLLEENNNATSIEKAELHKSESDKNEDPTPEITDASITAHEDVAPLKSSNNKDAHLMDYATIDETEDDIHYSLQFSLENFTHPHPCRLNDINPARLSHAPRILSNELITVDQMPLALQRALEHKLVKHSEPVETASKPSTSKPSTSKPSTSDADELFSENTAFAGFSNVMYDRTEPEVTAAHKLSSDNEHACEHTKTHDASKIAQVDEPPGNSDVNCQTVQLAERTRPKKTPERNKQYGVSSKLQDITEDFFRDIRLQQRRSAEQRCLRQRRRPTRMQNSIKNNDVQVEMVKFIQHITCGAKVVVQRLSTKNISAFTGKNSSLATCTH